MKAATKSTSKKKLAAKLKGGPDKRQNLTKPVINATEPPQLGDLALPTTKLNARDNYKTPPRIPYEDSTAFGLYLQEIGKVKLLTQKQEIELAKEVNRGDENAREKMIRANLRLVVKIARDYEGFGLPLLDLINEGNIGLMKAVDRFDHKKGVKFSTYSAWWIKQAIKRSLSNQAKTIRLPIYLVDRIAKLRQTAGKLREVLGHDPTDREIAEELGVTPERIDFMRRASARPVSLDEPISDDDSARLEEKVPDENADNPYDELELQTSVTLLNELLEQLNERESAILRYRFGLDGEKERTLEEVGQEFGVTRERIRQLQNIALQRLRRMMRKHTNPVLAPAFLAKN